MALKNINSFSEITSPLDSDALVISGADVTGPSVQDYVNNVASSVDDVDTILRVDKNTGRGTYITLAQFKNYMGGTPGIVNDGDSFVIKRSGTLYRVTASNLSAYLLPTPPTNNMFAWFDFTDAASLTLAGSLISQINDKSGNARHLTSTGSNRPTYNASGGSNNRPYASFANTNVLSNTSVTGSGVHTLYMVYKQNSFIDLAVLYKYNNDYDALRNRVINAINYMGVANDAQYGLFSNPALRFQWQIHMVSWTAAAGSISQLNHERRVTSSAGTVVNTMNKIQIGHATTGLTPNMHVSEVIIYDGLPSDAEDEQIRNYLHFKYRPTRNKSITFFGDSITQGNSGVSDPLRFCFAQRVARDKGYNIYNLGVGGTIVGAWSSATPTANDFEDRYTLAQQHDYDNNLLCIAYGTNEGSTSGNYNDWKALYKGLIQQVIAYGYDPANIVLCTPPYQSARPLMPNFVSKIAEIASELGLIYYNAYDDTFNQGGDSLLNVDGIHPTDAGHAVLAAGIEALILDA